MTERSWAARHWKLLLNIVTLGAFVLLIYLLRDQIVDTFQNLQNVNAWALLLLIPVQLLNYDAQTRMYRQLFAIVGNKLSYKSLYKTSLELNFVNHVFPSGGVSGISYFTLRLRDGREISSGKATLVHIMKIALYFLAFEVILLFGVFALAIMGQVNGLVILVAGSLSTLVFVGTGLFVYIIGSQRRINSFFVAMTKLLNRLIRLVRPRYPETINIDRARGVFNDFHDNYKAIKSNYRKLKAPFLYALIADATEIASVYVVYIAFGEWVNIGAVILAYGIANFAGLVSVLPGGVGVYEVLMTTVLAAAGVPPSLSLPVTVMYRVLNSLIQLPPGYYFYHKALKQGGTPAAGASGHG